MRSSVVEKGLVRAFRRISFPPWWKLLDSCKKLRDQVTRLLTCSHFGVKLGLVDRHHRIHRILFDCALVAIATCNIYLYFEKLGVEVRANGERVYQLSSTFNLNTRAGCSIATAHNLNIIADSELSFSA